MAGELTVAMDVMNTTRTEAVIRMAPEFADELFASLKRAEWLCRSRRNLIADADRIAQLANAIAGAADWADRMAGA